MATCISETGKNFITRLTEHTSRNTKKRISTITLLRITSFGTKLLTGPNNTNYFQTEQNAIIFLDKKNVRSCLLLNNKQLHTSITVMVNRAFYEYMCMNNCLGNHISQWGLFCFSKNLWNLLFDIWLSILQIMLIPIFRNHIFIGPLVF